jgi:hypothetical protein
LTHVRPSEVVSGVTCVCLRPSSTGWRLRVLFEQHPQVLTLQLKRFGFRSMFESKIGRHVAFSETLDLGPFMSDARSAGTPSVPYDLIGVVVHQGHDAHSGHYFSFVKSDKRGWTLMDDASVRPVGIATVLSAKAYVLVYRFRGAASTAAAGGAAPLSSAVPAVGTAVGTAAAGTTATPRQAVSLSALLAPSSGGGTAAFGTSTKADAAAVDALGSVEWRPAAGAARAGAGDDGSDSDSDSDSDSGGDSDSDSGSDGDSGSESGGGGAAERSPTRRIARLRLPGKRCVCVSALSVLLASTYLRVTSVCVACVVPVVAASKCSLAPPAASSAGGPSVSWPTV